jgi:hypothetical protein
MNKISRSLGNVSFFCSMRFRIFLISIILGAMLSGCVTPQQVAAESDYNLCRAAINGARLSQASMQELQRQIRIRNLDCSKYATAIVQQNAVDNAARLQYLQMLQQQDAQQNILIEQSVPMQNAPMPVNRAPAYSAPNNNQCWMAGNTMICRGANGQTTQCTQAGGGFICR